MNNMQVSSIGVSIRKLTKVFISHDKHDNTVAVDHVSLDINPGELVTLLGPSGCGKTTILRMLSGFTLPTEGSIKIGDMDMTNVPPSKRNVGMMFQSYALFPHLSVFNNVAYGLRVQKRPAEEIEKRVGEVLDMMRIREYADRIPEQLSGGQQQRVALARAVVTAPKILLFDEPLSNLDAKMREYMRDELRKIQQRLGITSIYVTHDQVEAMSISDRVVIMNHGKIEQIGTPHEIYVKPANAFVANFMGKADFAHGTVLSIHGCKAEVEILGARTSMSLNEDVPVKENDNVLVMIRPEMFHINPKGKFHGTVERATFFGEKMEYEIRIQDIVLVMNDSDFRQNGTYEVGDAMSVDIDETGLRILPEEK